SSQRYPLRPVLPCAETARGPAEVVRQRLAFSARQVQVPAGSVETEMADPVDKTGRALFKLQLNAAADRIAESFRQDPRTNRSIPSRPLFHHRRSGRRHTAA